MPLDRVNVRRAFLATALHLTITAVVTAMVVSLIAMVREVPLGTAFETASARALYPRPRLVVGVLSAFVAGWWGASGLSRRRFEQGILIGILIGVAALLLTLADHELRGRTVGISFQIAAAVAGAAFTALSPPIRRAFIAAAAQVMATIILFMSLSLIAVASLSGTPGQPGRHEVEVYQTLLPRLSLLLQTTMAFVAGWWGARRLTSDPIKQGVLIGVLIVGLSVLWLIILGGAADLGVIVFMLPAAAAAIAGAAFARSRDRRVPV